MSPPEGVRVAGVEDVGVCSIAVGANGSVVELVLPLEGRLRGVDALNGHLYEDVDFMGIVGLECAEVIAVEVEKL